MNCTRIQPIFDENEFFLSSPLDGQGTRHKYSYYPMSDENAAEQMLSFAD